MIRTTKEIKSRNTCKLIRGKNLKRKTGYNLESISCHTNFMKTNLCVLNFFYNCFESGGIVESEVSEHLTVDLDTCFMDKSHEF